MEPLEKVLHELKRYDHELLQFSAREREGEVELLIEVKNNDGHFHQYIAPIHPRDIGHSQFPWTFQRYLYDCMHDYMVELFIRTPQSRTAAE